MRAASKTMQFSVMATRKGVPSARRDVTVTIMQVPDIPKDTGAGPLTTGPAKGGIVEKFRPGVRDAIELVGYCCRSGTLIRLRKSECSGGTWFASQPPPGACPSGPVIK